MIPFDFDYYKANTLEEAYDLMQSSIEKGLKAVYYAGGTELVTNFRKGKDKADLVIDIKGIPDMMSIINEKETVTIGVGCSLNKIIDALNMPQITQVFSQIADHTTRYALSLGGNLCGRLPYKEAVLPLLGHGAVAILFGDQGLYEKPLREIFNKTLKIKSGDLLVQIKLNKDLGQSFAYRETEGTKVDYPILHLYVKKSSEEVFVALSGYASLPEFHLFSPKVLDELDPSKLEESQIYKVFEDKARACHRASVSYRQHLLKCALEDVHMAWKGGV